MSYFSASQRNMSTSQPNLQSPTPSSPPSSSSPSSIEKKGWFISKFLCRNLDEMTYLKISDQISELKALKTKVKLSSRGWKVGGRMDWSSPVSHESISLLDIHDICQDVTYVSALLVILKFDRVASDSMYEILAYKFQNPATARNFQNLFRRLTGTKESLMRTLSRTNMSINTLSPGIHYGGLNRGVGSQAGSYYKYQGQNKKDSVSDIDSVDNYNYRNNYNPNINSHNGSVVGMVAGGNNSHTIPRQEYANQNESVWNEGETKIYVGANRSVTDANRGMRDANRGMMSANRGMNNVELIDVEQSSVYSSNRGMDNMKVKSMDNLGVYNGGNKRVYDGGKPLSIHSGGSNGSYYSQQQHRFLQVPRIGLRSEADNSSITSLNGVFLLNPKFKRNYVARDGIGSGGSSNNVAVGGGNVGGGSSGGSGYNFISPYPQQETRFL